MTAHGRTDDGSDESIVSPKFAEQALLNGIGKLTKIDQVTLQVALKDGESAQEFSSSRTWTPPCTVLCLAAGPLALVNVTFLVANADLSAEELLIGLPVLQHLGINTKTLLEQKHDVIDGVDCSSIRNETAASRGGYVSRLMIARINRASNSTVDSDKPLDDLRPRVNYFCVREEEDPFPDASLLDPIDSDQHEDVIDATNGMVQTTIDSGFPNDKLPELRKNISDHTDIFRVSFSSGPPAQVPLLKIDLAPNATPVRVRLRNYSQEQRNFMPKMVSNLVKCSMVYLNPTSPWASAPLLVPKLGPAKFRFTVDLRPVNRFNIKHQFPMPIIEQELLKLADSTVYATFDLSHGYW